MQRWERVVAGGIAAALGLITAAVLAASAVGTTATRTDFFAVTLEDSTLYRLAIPPIAAEIHDSDIAEEVNVGPFVLTQVDVQRILHQEYEPEDLGLAARQFHSGLTAYVAAYPRDTVFEISIERHRPGLARAAMRDVVRGYRRLPECSGIEDLEVLLDAGVREILNDETEEEFVEGLPACSPPDLVQDPVLDGFRGRFREMIVEGPDSVEVFPDTDDTDMDAYSSLMSRIQRGMGILGWFPWIPLGLVAFLNVAVATGGVRTHVLPNGWTLAFATGLSLLMVGYLFSAGGGGQLILDLFGADPAGMERIGRMWLAVGRYGIQSVLGSVGEAMMLTGAVLGAGATAGSLAHTADVREDWKLADDPVLQRPA